MNERDFERREKARQDAMFDAQFADEPTSDVEYADEPPCKTGSQCTNKCQRCGEINPAEIHTCSPEPQVNGWPLYSGLPKLIKPTQEQVIAWAREAGDAEGLSEFFFHPVIERFAALAYEAGRKDAFQDGAKAMFDALLFRVANNWHPRAQEQCDVENEWATAWAADALDEVSPEDCAEWKSIKESWKDGYEAGRKDENEECAVIAFNAKTYIEAAAAIRARREQ